MDNEINLAVKQIALSVQEHDKECHNLMTRHCSPINGVWDSDTHRNEYTYHFRTARGLERLIQTNTDYYQLFLKYRNDKK